jgi:DNA-binding IclR family transcriptional regulator
MPTTKILQLLTKQGERLDTEIAKSIGLPLNETRQYLEAMTADGRIMSCHIIRYEGGKEIKGMTCRVAGFIPKPAPGKKTM